MTEGKISSYRVILLGAALVGVGAIGFHAIPGMISDDATGSRWVNAVYCSVITLTTVGFGDICPAELTSFGRIFIVALSLSGLGMFCGPIMDLTSSWKDKIPIGGELALLTLLVTTAVFIFSHLLGEMTQHEAVYFSIITGTTIGYGDISPKTDMGKLAVALYAILAINVVASILEPAMQFLLTFCVVPTDDKTTTKAQAKKQTKQSALQQKGAQNANGEAKKKKKKKKKTS